MRTERPLGAEETALLQPADLVEPFISRFWARVDKNGPIPEKWPELGNCWVWTGKPISVKSPYGQMNYGNQKVTQAHRIGHVLTQGPIPDKMWIDHLCLNTMCVRHTEVVTPGENLRRRDLVAAGMYWEEMRNAW